MIGGVTHGSGGAALGKHLSDEKNNNEFTALGASRGLMADDIRSQISELSKLASASRSKHSSIGHFHIDPPESAKWGDEEFSEHRARLEKEFGLEKQPFSESIHIKNDREHRHWTYSLYDEENRKTIKLSNSFQRIEKLSRMAEFDTGQDFIIGRHNRAVFHALKTERPEIAEAIQKAGLTDAPRPSAMSPKDRAQQERTQVAKADIARITASAWAQSDNGPAFAQALKTQGLALAQGDKTILVVDPSGNAHSLQRMLAMDAKAQNSPAPKSADINSRIEGVDLPSLHEVKREILNPTNIQNPDPTPPATPTPLTPPAGPAPTEKPVEQASRENLAQHAPTSSKAPAPALGGGGGGSASVSQSSPAPSLEPAGEGPGEPPRHGASPDELAKFRAKLSEYNERKEKNLQRFMQALASQEESKKKGGNQPAQSSEEIKNVGVVDWQKNGIIEAIRKGYEEAEAKRELSAALEILASRYGGPSQGNEASPSERPDSGRKGSGSGGINSGPSDTHGRRGTDAAPAGHRLSDGHDGIEQANRRQIIQNRAEDGRVNFALTFVDMTRLEKARDALKPSIMYPTEGMNKKDRYEAIQNYRSELVEVFKRDKADLRFVQKHEWKGNFGQLRIQTDAVKEVLQKHRGRFSPTMYQEAYEARKQARDNLGKSLKTGQENQKETFNQWLERQAETDPRAFAVFADMEKRKAEKLAISIAIEGEQNRIASERARAPFPDPATRDPNAMERRVREAAYAPLHEAQDGLKLAIKNLEATPKPKGFLAWIGWPTSEVREREEAEQAVSLAHAKVEASRPRGVEDAKARARTDAENAKKAHSEWQKTAGQELDRRESLICGVQESLENGDQKMKAALLNGGIEAALRLQSVREAEEAKRIQEQEKIERGNVIPMFQEQEYKF